MIATLITVQCAAALIVAGYLVLSGPRFFGSGQTIVLTPNPMGTEEQAIDFVKHWIPIGGTETIGGSIAWHEEHNPDIAKTIKWVAIRNTSADGWRVQWHRTLNGAPTYSEWWYNPASKTVIPMVDAW